MSDVCEQCGESIDQPRWVRHEGDTQLVFCSDECRSDWGFERAMADLKQFAGQDNV